MKCYILILFSFLSVILSGCLPESNKQSISLTPTYINKPIACFNELKVNSEDWHVKQLSLYLSEFKVFTDGGNWQPIQLSTNQFQSAGVVYLGGLCQKSEQSGNWQIEYLGEPLKGKKIQFTLGVPFELNHLNPIKQISPLNMPSMFWVWRIGHKFLRLEMTGRDNDWLFHLGSLGCKSASVVRAPTKPCLYPNSFNFEVELSDEIANIQFDLAKLLNQLVISREEYCQSEQDIHTCQVLFKNLKEKAVFRAN